MLARFLAGLLMMVGGKSHHGYGVAEEDFQHLEVAGCGDLACNTWGHFVPHYKCSQ